MKNRFYGDERDYFKYGLLDVLSSKYESIGINWYLTDDSYGNLNLGKKIGYLNKKEKWIHYNPKIFTSLRERVNNGQRMVKYCAIDNMIKNFKYEAIEPLPDNAEISNYQQLRSNWHSRAKNILYKCDLVFFDPDIGVKFNEKLPDKIDKKCEYATIEEINQYSWCDWLVIQFLQHKNRFDQLCINPITESANKRNKKVAALITSDVAFLYVANNLDLTLLRQVFKEWDTKIRTQILIA
jgi:hypothetical protein